MNKLKLDFNQDGVVRFESLPTCKECGKYLHQGNCYSVTCDTGMQNLKQFHEKYVQRVHKGVK